MMLDDKLLPLIMGGEITSHSHPHLVTLDQLHRMQQLEVVVFALSDYTCREQDDFIFVDSTAAPVTITLHPAQYGQHITVCRYKGSNTVTIAAAAGETINLVASVDITASFVPRRFKGLVSQSGAIHRQQINPAGPIYPVAGYLEI